MDNTFDRMFYSEAELIGGVDESGVSDIAGSLVAACVILPKIDIHRDDLRIFEVDDSKKIPERYRKRHAEIIWQSAIAIGIGETQPAEIDYLGRFEARRLAMLRAVVACKSVNKGKPVKPQYLLVDGGVNVPINIRQTSIRAGDQKSLCIAAASVIAKVYRDDLMIRLHERFPFYGWINNKGFPCEKQFSGLDEHGIQLGIHRVASLGIIRSRMEPAKAAERLALWKSKTAALLGREVGENLWTANPPSSRPSTPYKPPAPPPAKSGTVTKPSKRKP